MRVDTPRLDVWGVQGVLQQDPYLLASAYTIFPAACERS